MTYRVIQVGSGGRGVDWCRKILPPNIEDGLVEVVAAVDLVPETFKNAQEGLGLRADQCYTDIGVAFDENEADFATVVVPPAFHEEVVDVILDHDMHVLSEKPIAASMAASARIFHKVKSAGKKMGVTMSHRFDQDKTTLRRELHSGDYGALDYLICRFTCDCRQYASWGRAHRYEMEDPLMIEGSVHHLDILADLAGAKCDTLYAHTWNPPWGEFAGDSQALVTMYFENGSRAFYEGAMTNSVSLNCWLDEYIRAECEKATFILDHRQLERFTYDSSKRVNAQEGEGEKVPLIDQDKWADSWLVEKFVHWLDGGEAMETNLEDNLQSVALIYASIESSRTGKPVKVQEFLGKALQEI